MLEVFFGNDVTRVRAAALARIDALKKSGVSIEQIDADSYEAGVLADAVGAQSLFGTDTAYLIDTPSTLSTFYEEVLTYVSVCAESPHVFIVIEDALLAPEKKKFAKHANVIEEYKKQGEERFNAFAMADSLAKRDKKTLWLQLQEAKAAGLSAEEIIGTLWWQLKTMRLAARTASAQEAELKDFPYNKAKRALSNFADGRIEQLSRELLEVYHQARAGKKDIDLSLEAWVLGV